MAHAKTGIARVEMNTKITQSPRNPAGPHSSETNEGADSTRAVAVVMSGQASPGRPPHGESGVSELDADATGSAEYPLVASRVDVKPTVVDVRGVPIGAGVFQLIAGPCAVESKDQLFRIAEVAAGAGAKFLRGGAFKPRTSPYSFQGLGAEGLRILAEASRQFDLRIITEVKDCETLPAVAEVADILQIGSRNMQNFSLLEAVGRLRKPVLLKRGMGARLVELFMAAEYVIAQGNPNVILCERGIRTFETMTRNTFDVGAIVMMKRRTHLPVTADPSHGIGIPWAVPALARAAVVAGSDAVMIEIHDDPGHALSDGQQALTLGEFERLAPELMELAAWMKSRDLQQQ